MSRSYKKYASCGICCGNNTPYYRARNRSTRNKNRQMLRNMLANKSIEDIANEMYHVTNKTNTDFDTWNEPTDGKWYAKTYEDYLGSGYIKWLTTMDPNMAIRELQWFNKCKRK